MIALAKEMDVAPAEIWDDEEQGKILAGQLHHIM